MFWTVIAVTSSELRQRSVTVCERQSALLAGWPVRVRRWRVGPRHVTEWPTVGEEGRLASDPQPGLGCVETLGGRERELGTPVDP